MPRLGNHLAIICAEASWPFRVWVGIPQSRCLGRSQVEPEGMLLRPIIAYN